MLYEGELVIDEKRYDDIIRIGYEAAKKNLMRFESKYSCTFLDINPMVKECLTPAEYDEWRISYIALKNLKEKIN